MGDDTMTEQKLESNQEIIINTIQTFPGLRFNEIKKEISIANGTLQHHLAALQKFGIIRVDYDNVTPRYFSKEINTESQIIIKRLNQPTTSKIIKLLLKKECQIFAQMVKYTKKSAGTVSIYKNVLLKDGIIMGDTGSCSSCRNAAHKIKYRLTNPEKVRAIVLDYGKTSLQKSVDNLSDVFLSLK